MKKMFVAFGIAIALVVSCIGIANWWTGMKAENERAYQVYISEKVEREAELNAYVDQLGDALDQEYVRYGVFDEGTNYW